MKRLLFVIACCLIAGTASFVFAQDASSDKPFVVETPQAPGTSDETAQPPETQQKKMFRQR